MESLTKKVKRIVNEINDNNFDIILNLKILFDLIFHQKDEYYNPQINYNKEYFASYYDVDKKTFNKWLSLFCPDIYKNNIRSKRKFNKVEFNLIINTFGKCNHKTLRTLTKDELSLSVYFDIKSKKKRMSFLNEDLNNFKPIYNTLNKFPPKVVEEIQFSINQIKINSSMFDSQTEYTPELIINKLESQVEEIKKMSTYQREIYVNELKAKGREVLKEMMDK